MRIQLGRALEMAESLPDSETCDAKVSKRFGRQKEFEFSHGAGISPVFLPPEERSLAAPLGPLRWVEVRFPIESNGATYKKLQD